jgi:Flp pilus assembly pilin Flp
MYRELDATKIVETAHTLRQRINERFPDSGLSRVAGELHVVAQEADNVSAWLARPLWPIRIAVGLAAALIAVVSVAALVAMLTAVKPAHAFTSIAELLIGLDAGINDIVLFSLAIFFLFSLETRLKRKKALRAMHALRSLAHIIDMHQLTKDPERITGRIVGLDTLSSPKRTLTPFELTRYLDYCAEALAVISKLAALYVQHFHDPVTLSSVNELEELTNGLSRKIWQKIMILDRVITEGEDPA